MSVTDEQKVLAKLRTEQRKLAIVQEVSRALSSDLTLEQLLDLIMDKATELVGADRSTLFLVSDDGRTLWSKVLAGGEMREIRLNVGEGIAGWVAESGETVNIPDAYSDDRFQPRVDHESGYRTRSILCMPMRDTTGKITGVLQLLNKQDGQPFDQEDEELLASLASQAAISIQNSRMFHSIVAKNVELLTAQRELEDKSSDLRVLYENEREFSSAKDLRELLDRLLARAVELLDAEAGAIALSEQDGLHFVTVRGGAAERLLDRTFDSEKGLIGWVYQNRRPALVKEPAADPRHDADLAESLGWTPRNIICAPLLAQDEAFGAIEILDKRPPSGRSTRPTRPGFTEADLQKLSLIAGQAARAIQITRGRLEREKENRLASIGQLLAGVLHDLKTPMTIISGYAQLMAANKDEAQRTEYVDQIQRQFDLMSGMTREVLAFARGESNLLIRKVYLNRFFETVRTQLRHAFARRNVSLEIEEGFTGLAYFDENSMLRLVHNLAQNAADAMPDGGTFRIVSSADDEWIRLEFHDEGEGIPDHLAANLFDPFASGKENGTGLGLAIVKKIVDEHGGQIEVQSHAGKGTVFSVALPKNKPVGVEDAESREH